MSPNETATRAIFSGLSLVRSYYSSRQYRGGSFVKSVCLHLASVLVTSLVFLNQHDLEGELVVMYDLQHGNFLSRVIRD